MQEHDRLTVTQKTPNHWVVQRGREEIAGGLTRQAAEAERELVQRLRRRTEQVRSTMPRRARGVERGPR